MVRIPAAEDHRLLLSRPLHGVLLMLEGLKPARMSFPPDLNGPAFCPLRDCRHTASLCQNCINERVPARRSRSERALTIAKPLIYWWFLIGKMVGVARIELATPAMSTQCSTTELHAHRGGPGPF